MSDWKPWDIPSDGPPCARLRCVHWKPQFKFYRWQDGSEHPDGIRFCQAPEMHHDFSCFVSPPSTTVRDK